MNLGTHHLLTIAGVGGDSSTPWRDVTDQQIRIWRGDFCGIYMAEIAPQCPRDPLTDILCKFTGLNNGLFFSTHLGNYPQELWPLILDRYKRANGGRYSLGLRHQRPLPILLSQRSIIRLAAEQLVNGMARPGSNI